MCSFHDSQPMLSRPTRRYVQLFVATKYFLITRQGQILKTFDFVDIFMTSTDENISRSQAFCQQRRSMEDVAFIEICTRRYGNDIQLNLHEINVAVFTDTAVEFVWIAPPYLQQEKQLLRVMSLHGRLYIYKLYMYNRSPQHNCRSKLDALY